MTAKKCTKKCAARAELLFSNINLFFLPFSLPSPAFEKNNVTDRETIIWACTDKVVLLSVTMAFSCGRAKAIQKRNV